MIPKYHEMFRDILEYMAVGGIHAAYEIREYIITKRQISNADLSKRTPDGKHKRFTLNFNKAQHLLRAYGLIHSEKRGVCSISNSGRKLIETVAGAISPSVIREFVNSKQKWSPTTIELFAGAGGLARGIEKAGFDTLALIEWDKDAAATLKHNRPNWRVINEDISKIAPQDLEKYFYINKGELDLLSGGAPCQAFSYAGKRLGLEDTRGTLFYYFASFLQKLQPKVFLFENVRGLLTHDKGRTYNTICNIFSDSGYVVKYKVLNAWDYGTAQKRERLITIGVREDLADRLSVSFPVPHDYKPVLRDVLKDVPESPGAVYSEHKRKIFELVPPGGYWRDIDAAIAKSYMKSCWEMEGGRTGILRRLSMDEPSLTVLTAPSQKQTDRCHPLEARPFTVRENARIQGFDDSWHFCGGIGSQYRQVGNAVPVNLAYEIAKEIKKGLEDSGI